MLVRLGERVADVPGHGLAGAVVPALLNPRPQILYRRLRGVEAHRGGLRDRIGVHGKDAARLPEHLLDNRLFRGVMQAADVQHRRFQSEHGGPALISPRLRGPGSTSRIRPPPEPLPPPMPRIIIHTMAPIISMQGSANRAQATFAPATDRADGGDQNGCTAPHHFHRVSMARRYAERPRYHPYLPISAWKTTGPAVESPEG